MIVSFNLCRASIKHGRCTLLMSFAKLLRCNKVPVIAFL